MPQEHYFSNEPLGEFRAKTIEVTLAGNRVSVETAGSIFSPDHVDTGTAVLLELLDEAPAIGDVLDIGCGWGPIALSLAMSRPHLTVWAVDVNERALELTRRNAEKLGLTNVKVCQPDQVPKDLKFSGIWSNPPIRVGKEVLHDILTTWLPRLASGAEGYLVVQKNLGADSLLRWLQDALPKKFVSLRLETSKSFRVIRVTNKN
jgi:16S rRNA (guanine1207-N2)-methyltransferase